MQRVIFFSLTLKGSSSPFRKIDNWTHVDNSGTAVAVTNTQWKVVTVLRFEVGLKDNVFPEINFPIKTELGKTSFLLSIIIKTES